MINSSNHNLDNDSNIVNENENVISDVYADRLVNTDMDNRKEEYNIQYYIYDNEIDIDEQRRILEYYERRKHNVDESEQDEDIDEDMDDNDDDNDEEEDVEQNRDRIRGNSNGNIINNEIDIDEQRRILEYYERRKHNVDESEQDEDIDEDMDDNDDDNDEEEDVEQNRDRIRGNSNGNIINNDIHRN